MTKLETSDSKVFGEVLSVLEKIEKNEGTRVKHVSAKSITDAIYILNKYGKKAKIIAGGTDIVRLMRNRIVAPKIMVNIKTIPELGYIRDDDGLKIGSLTTIADIEVSPIIRNKYSMIAQAARLVASPQIRNSATIVGDLCQDVNCWYYRLSPATGRIFNCYRKGGAYCYADPGDNRYHAIFNTGECHAVCLSDMAPVLLALDAKVKIVNLSGERIIPLENLYTSIGNILEPDEMITEIQIPSPMPQIKQCYLKFRARKAIDPAIVSVATAIVIQEGKVSAAKILLGGVASVPYRSAEAEEILIGKMLTKEIAELTARIALSKAIPMSMNAYKIPIAEALIPRALLG